MRYLFALLMILLCFQGFSQPTFELSRNVYRIPYGNGTAIRINQDHFTHDPLGRYDMEGYLLGDACNVYPIAAAAAGVVRYAVDNHDTSCSGCGIYNNYVWIEHRNGEWTKYTHFSNGSVDDAGIRVGDTVAAGTILGFQCYVGSTSPAYNEHLHFEVRRPFNSTNPPIDPAGGFLAAADGDHLIPVINSISKHYWEKDDQMTASGNNSCTNSSISTGAQTIGFDVIRIFMASSTIDHGGNAVIFQNGGNGLFHAGTSVTLSPGFHAQSGSSVTARIGNCAPTAF